MIDNPCRFCQTRSFKCHATCPEHAKYRAEIERIRNAERSKKQSDEAYYATKQKVKKLAEQS